MAASRTTVCFAVSGQLFRLATEGIRLHSNEMNALSSLARLIQARRSSFPDSLPRHGTALLREHFSAVPSAGPIRIVCRLPQVDLDGLTAVQAWLRRDMAMKADVADALSALLFDYAVERAALRMLDRLRLDELVPRLPDGDQRGHPADKNS